MYENSEDYKDYNRHRLMVVQRLSQDCDTRPLQLILEDVYDQGHRDGWAAGYQAREKDMKQKKTLVELW